MKVQRKQRGTYRLDTYVQYEKTFHTANDGLPASNVTQLAIGTNGTVWAGTSKGVAKFDGGRWQQAHSALPAENVSMLYSDRNGKVWAMIGNALYRCTNGSWQKDGLTASVVAMDEDDKGQLWAATPDGVYTFEREEWTMFKPHRTMDVRDMATFGDGRIYLATNEGVYGLMGKRPVFILIPERERELASNDVRSIVADKWGHLWIGTDKGVSVYDDHAFFHQFTGANGLPYEDIHLVTEAIGGERWFGTSVGAIRLKDGRWKYCASKRWLPSDRVQAIAIQDEQTVWVGTDQGIACIEKKAMTLEEKARYYDDVVERYHKRHHFVTIRSLTEPGNMASGGVHISDNDGLWTAAYVAAQAYRYAVTGDKDARQKAKQSVHAMLDLLDITGRKGFFARAMVHKSEPEFGKIGPRHEWHLSADGEWEWKGETSSDEATGHFYAYAVYYDLLADEEDKKRIQDAVRDIMDHILDHDYTLTDVDGTSTTWAVWTPQKLNRDLKWHYQRGINALQLLSFLKTTAHITGDDKYERVYESLIRNEHYALNTLEQKIEYNGKADSIDDNLGFQAYLPLLAYETDPHLRELYLLSLEHHWQFERPERSPFWNAIYGALTGRMGDIEAGIETLAEMPLDLINYPIQNSHRADLIYDDEPSKHGEKLLKHPLPFDERPLHKWDKHPYGVDGGDGKKAEDGTLFMHPYWLARYWGVMTENDNE